MATEFTIGAPANCSDGSCGEVVGVITDPVARTVTHLVIQPRYRPDRGRLVPLELVDPSAGHVRLRCTLAEFDQLEPAEEVDPIPASDYGGVIPAAASGMIVGDTPGFAMPFTIQDAVPLGETEVRHGDPVHAVDGEIGRVQGFIVDPDDHRVTHVLLREGHLWGRKEVTIPISAVTGFDGGIRLSITKRQVEDLPPAG